MFYPQGVVPIHEVHEWGKVRAMARAVEAGEELPPVLLLGNMLLTGTHRWVANSLLERRGRTERRIASVQLRTLPLDIQILVIELYMQPDMAMVQEVFEDYLYSEGHRYAGWRACQEMVSQGDYTDVHGNYGTGASGSQLHASPSRADTQGI